MWLELGGRAGCASMRKLHSNKFSRGENFAIQHNFCFSRAFIFAGI